MYKSRARAIRAVMESNPANETTGVPLDDLVEALGFSKTRVTSWLLQLVANGDVIWVTKQPARFKWIQPAAECTIAPKQEPSIEMMARLFTMPKFGHDWR